jgi:tetratricopeptide (TPR) repeat protein
MPLTAARNSLCLGLAALLLSFTGLSLFAQTTPQATGKDNYACGVAALEKKDYAKAIACLSEGIRQAPSAAAYLKRGQAYEGKEDFDKAIADYNEAIRLDPKNAEGFARRGHAYAKGKSDDRRSIADCTRPCGSTRRISRPSSPAGLHTAGWARLTRALAI